MTSPAIPLPLAALWPQLQAFTAGLLFISESDAPLLPVQYPRPAGPLPGPAFLTALGEPADAPVQVVELAYFLRQHTAPAGVLGNEALAARYRALQTFLEQHLRQVQVYRVGEEPQIHAYALGQLGEEALVGFSTVLIET